MSMGNSEPNIIPRSAHHLSRKDIDPDALKVLYRLHRSGFKAYLVGGAVRDLLLGKKPKDFDVATDARPGQIKKLFANCFLIGRRFRLAHIRFKGGKIIEVATFRREPHEIEEPDADKNNTFGTPMEDAFRRDITINALFYDIATFSIIDYVGGLNDIRNRQICIVGDPSIRYVEDPVRMWRVLRYACRHGFAIEAESDRALSAHRELLALSSGSRLFEELNKDLASGSSAPFFRMTVSHSMLGIILGDIGRRLEKPGKIQESFFESLHILDDAVRKGEEITQDMAYCLFFWAWVQGILEEKGHLAGDRAKLIIDEISAASMPVVIPKALRSNVAHTLYILDRMLNALRTGRLKRTLSRRTRYADALRLFSLLEHQKMKEGDDPFARAFRMKFSGQENVEKKDFRKKRRRRRRRNSAEQAEPPAQPAQIA